jgi:hypothetical protein
MQDAMQDAKQDAMHQPCIVPQRCHASAMHRASAMQDARCKALGAYHKYHHVGGCRACRAACRVLPVRFSLCGQARGSCRHDLREV